MSLTPTTLFVRAIVVALALTGCDKSAKEPAVDKSKVSAAWLDVTKIANESFGEWAQTHASKACPDKVEDLIVNAESRNDPWGHPYVMLCGPNLPPNVKGGIGIVSLGPDGKQGTADDIKSWETQPSK
jgi:hypothetical protein